MNQLEIHDEALKALLAIAVTKASDNPEDMREDIDGMVTEARRVLRLAGYDFNMLMGSSLTSGAVRKPINLGNTEA